ncbi:predicted protein [Postia placenta Mad-698-R]|nr:predicted protein [Postia placenta Mad-698-R]
MLTTVARRCPDSRQEMLKMIRGVLASQSEIADAQTCGSLGLASLPVAYSPLVTWQQAAQSEQTKQSDPAVPCRIARGRRDQELELRTELLGDRFLDEGHLLPFFLRAVESNPEGLQHWGWQTGTKFGNFEAIDQAFIPSERRWGDSLKHRTPYNLKAVECYSPGHLYGVKIHCGSLQVYEGERPLKMLKLRFGQPLPRKTCSAKHCSKPAWQRKRARVSTLMRREICTYKRDHPNATPEAIGRIFKVARATVCRTLKDKASISRLAGLENNLWRWAERRTLDKKLIKDKDILIEAKEIHETFPGLAKGAFKASKTWLRNFKRRHGISKGVILADAERDKWSAAFGFAGEGPYTASKMAADILSKYPDNLDVLHDPTYTPPDISGLHPGAVVHNVIDLAALSAMIPRTPTPEPQPPTVTKRGPERVVHSIDSAALAASIFRTPTPDLLAESPAAVLDIDAFAVKTS